MGSPIEESTIVVYMEQHMCVQISILPAISGILLRLFERPRIGPTACPATILFGAPMLGCGFDVDGALVAEVEAISDASCVVVVVVQSPSIALEALRLNCSRKLSICMVSHDEDAAGVDDFHFR